MASIGRVSTSQLNELLLELKEHTHTIGEAQSDLKPWQKHSSQTKDKINNCPEQLTVVLADQIYIPIELLPGKLTSKLKHCAVFPNPEFYKRQAMHYSTFGTSRLIWSVHIEGGYLILPRGCLAAVKTILKEQNIALSYDDKRYGGSQLEKIRFAGKLKSQQTKAVSALIKQDNGILVAPTSFGKTVVALALIAKRKIPWSEMSKAQRKAFQHSYSRHAEEMGLPKWRQSNEEELRTLFNIVVGHIRKTWTHLGPE